MLKTQKILCISGGVDSVIAYFYLNRPKSVYFNLNTRCTRKELRCIRRLRQFGIDPSIDNSLKLGKWERPDAYLPLRNLILASTASNYSNNIYIIGIKGDNCPDKSEKAYKLMSKHLTEISKPEDRPIQVLSPFWNMTKSDIINWLIKKKGKIFVQRLLQTSVSCYSKGLKSCGKCPSCFRKAVAMSYCGLNIDFFENNIRTWEKIPKYIKKFRTGFYDYQRTKETLEVLKTW